MAVPPLAQAGSIAIEAVRQKVREEPHMKVTVDVDCTPEEARRFLGLPDLGPVHEAYVAKMKSAVTDGPTPEMFGDMMKAWGPMNEAGLNSGEQKLAQVGRKGGPVHGPP